jgi:hypothetical protein
MTAQINQTEVLLDWLELKLEKRLKIFPDILNNPEVQHTAAAKHVRVLCSAIEILRGGRYLPHIKRELIDDLRQEKNFLFEMMGKRTCSFDMYENIIDYLKTLPQ